MKYLLALVVVLGLLVAGCDGDDHAEVDYRPAAYGENNQCYYIHDPAEVIALQQGGMCPSGWAPYPAPLWWHQTYAVYYHSPAYVEVYVPPTSRTVYVTEVQRFETRYRTEIDQRQASATWKGSDGKTYDGKTVDSQVKSGQASFAGGSVRSSGGSGGSVKTDSPSGSSSSSSSTKTSTGSSSTSGSKPAAPPPPKVK